MKKSGDIVSGKLPNKYTRAYVISIAIISKRSVLGSTLGFTGTDLSPVQPNDVPENVHFLVDDATKEDWMWGPNHFDLVHLADRSPAQKISCGRHPPTSNQAEWHEIDPRAMCDDDTLPPMNPDGYSEYPFSSLRF